MAEITTIKLGSLYMNGVAIKYSNTPISYISNTSLELKQSSKNSDEIIEWVSFTSGVKKFLLSTKNILSNISYNDLLRQSLINGNITITLNSIVYKIRIFSSEEWDDFFCNSIALNTLLTPTQNDLTDNYYTPDTISTSDTNNLLHWWGQPSLTQDINSNNVTVRGGTNIKANNSIDISSKAGYYRIVLEQYDYPPTISDSDGSLGSYSSNNISKIYSIIDPDDDLFRIETLLDGTIISTLENQVSKTDFTFSLTSNQWSSLSIGKHTIIIQVTDTYGNIAQRKWLFNKISTESGTTTTLARPSITTEDGSLLLYPINALDDNKINFFVIGGDLVYANEFSITDNSTQVEIYRRKVESFVFYHTIPASTMTNGHIYQLKVRTYNENDQYSQWSDSVLVRTLTPMELIITTIINGQIETQNPVFNATFEQDENEEIYSYQYILYKDGTKIDYSSELKDGLLSYQFSNLENKTNYDVELIVKTKNGLEGNIIQSFYCIYLQTRLPSVMTLSNNDTKGSVLIETDVHQIIGRIYSGDTINYIDNEWADLHNTIVIYDDISAFRLERDWTAKLWARDLEDNNNMIVKFSMDDGYIELSRWKNMFSLSKYVNNIKLYEIHSFIEGNILSTDVFYFFIQNDTVNGLMNLDVKRVTKGRSTWFTQSSSDDVAPTYSIEDGFLANLNEDFKALLLDQTIDGETLKVCIPTQSDIKNNSLITNCENIYYTKTVDTTDSNKLIVVNTDGTLTSKYPNDVTVGIRIVIKVSNALKVSQYKDSDNYHYITTIPNNKFNTIKLSDLNSGDKLKGYNIKYNNEIIPFSILSKNATDSTVNLISDVIMVKEFDNSEAIYVNGNPSWNLSNLRQWLNSNIRIG
jgi:hypothetical protein